MCVLLSDRSRVGRSGAAAPWRGSAAWAGKGLRLRALTADAPQRPGEPEVCDGVRGLGAVARLKLRDEVQGAAVVAAMTGSTERHDAQRVIAAAERARHEVRGIDPRRGAADQAAFARDLGALWRRGRRERLAP